LGHFKLGLGINLIKKIIIMESVKGTCRKCGKTYGYYAGKDSAKNNVSKHDCKKGGKCDADV